MQLEPKSNAVGTQKQCSWSPKAMQLEHESYAVGVQKHCRRKTTKMLQKDGIYAIENTLFSLDKMSLIVFNASEKSLF
jgi:hypothetical protein